MIGEIATYQKRVQELTDEVRRLRRELQSERGARRDELKVLKAQLREGLTPELLATRRELTRWRDRALAAEGRLREVMR